MGPKKQKFSLVPFQLFLASLLPLAALASPSGYGGKHCTVEYETVMEKVCRPSYTKACEDGSETKSRTEYEQKCENLTRKECYPVPKEIDTQKCLPVLKKVCTNETQRIYKTQLEKKCQDVVQQVKLLRCLGSEGYGIRA